MGGFRGRGDQNSWGFGRIIQAHPRLSRGNPQAMCAWEPESWEWTRRAIDFVFERIPLPTVQPQRLKAL